MPAGRNWERLRVFREACIKAADDYDDEAISGDEIRAAVEARWHRENKIKPSDVKK